MGEKSYGELLRDPRWQRKRLEILERDMWECTVCEDKTSTLHVHHKVYRKGLKPWEAPGDDLTTVCENCHKAYGEQAERLKELIAKMSFGDIDLMIGYGSALHGYCAGEDSIKVNGPNDATGIARFFGLRFQDVLGAEKDGSVCPDELFALREAQER